MGDLYCGQRADQLERERRERLPRRETLERPNGWLLVLMAAAAIAAVLI